MCMCMFPWHHGRSGRSGHCGHYVHVDMWARACEQHLLGNHINKVEAGQLCDPRVERNERETELQVSVRLEPSQLPA